MGKKNINDDSRTTPMGLFATGKDYKISCQIISEKYSDWPGLNSKLIKVRLYLVGHALELLFKAILLQRGVAVSELKSGYGHNIISLLDKIDSPPFASLTDSEKESLVLLDFNYSQKDFEYSVIGTKQYPVVANLIKLSCRLFADTEKWLHSEIIKKISESKM